MRIQWHESAWEDYLNWQAGTAKGRFVRMVEQKD